MYYLSASNEQWYSKAEQRLLRISDYIKVLCNISVFYSCVFFCDKKKFPHAPLQVQMLGFPLQSVCERNLGAMLARTGVQWPKPFPEGP